MLCSADINTTAAYDSALTCKKTLTLHIHTHLRLQGTCKLEVEGCHLWLSRQKYSPILLYTRSIIHRTNTNQFSTNVIVQINPSESAYWLRISDMQVVDIRQSHAK